MKNNLFSPGCFILILTCLLCSFPSIKPLVAATPLSSTKVVLSPGMTGSEVKVLQIQLKALGFYQQAIDGDYGPSTRNAVVQFQKARGLDRVDGIADIATQKYLTEIISGQSKLETTTKPQTNSNSTADNTNTKSSNTQQNQNFIWGSLLGLGLLTTIGAVTYLGMRFRKTSTSTELSPQTFLYPLPKANEHQDITLLKSADPQAIQIPTDLVALEKKPLLTQLNHCDELIQELLQDNSKKRRQAIWKLGQQGDSRAVKPLLDLMVDADSEQQSLIVSTLVDIGNSTLKPMNRALTMSIQDENPQVRKNAIRDLVRVYDMVGKMSKIVLYAMEDPDPEVQETARYALGQINRIRTTEDKSVVTEISPEDR